MSNDHLIFEKEADVVEILLHPDPKLRKRRTEKQKAKSLSHTKIVKSTREKRNRVIRLVEGLCTHCGKVPPMEGRRLCDGCGEKALQRKAASRYRRTILGADDDRE
jgi:hypothetical protein